ncbi:MAG: hypothetical protein FGM24_02625 [Candidatus Kapabacteria bacterium]|nr:hypothetical protein [Candidatus Kapabacteria bacterium]
MYAMTESSTGICRRKVGAFLAWAFVIFAYGGALKAQDGNVGIGTLTPDRSAILDLVASDRGLLIPRLSTIERDAIMLPATGLLVFNVTQLRFEYNAGTPLLPQWRTLAAGQDAVGADQVWLLTGNANLPPEAVLGSTDASTLRIVTNNTERLRIDGTDGRITMTSLAGQPEVGLDLAMAGPVVALGDGRLVKADRSALVTILGVHAGRYVNATNEVQFNVVIVVPTATALSAEASITVTPESVTSVSITPFIVRSSRLADRFTISFPGGLNPGEAINWMVVDR